MGQMKRKGRFGVLADRNVERKEVRYCERCSEFRIVSVLRPKIIMPNEVKQSDYDLWLQCYRCGTVFAKYETKVESKIQPFTEVSDNPHSQGKKIVGAQDKRSRKKKTPIEKQRERQRRAIEKEKDPEIKEALRRGLIVKKLNSFD